MNIIDALIFCKLVKSKSEAKRVINQGGIYIDGCKIKDIYYNINKTVVIKKGKIHFVRLVFL